MTKSRFPNQFWVVGTGTGVGKTLVSALLVHALGARYWKPIQTGAREDSDSRTVASLSGAAEADILKEAYIFDEPLSPHAAAALEDRYINPGEIIFPEPDSRPLVIEAAGGLLVPLNNDVLQIDLIAQSHLPVVLVGQNDLGTINHTLLSLHALYQRTIPVVGVILSGPPSEIHLNAIENFGFTPVLAQIPQLATVTPAQIAELSLNFFAD